MRKLFLALCLLCLCGLSAAVYAEGTPANTAIQNGGDSGTANTADVAGDTVVNWLVGSATNYATCGVVNVTVSTGYAIAALPSPSNQALTPGSTAYYTYYVRNAGNATDTLSLAVSTITGQGWNATIYRDDNGDGVHQANETYVVSQSSALAAETSFYFFVAVVIPSNAADSSSTTVRLTVKDKNGAGTEDNWLVAGNDTRTSDTITTCVAATLTMVKNANVSQARPQTDEIVYTSTVTASGSGTAGSVVYKDKIPANSNYVTGTLVRRLWPAARETLTDASGDDAGTYDSPSQTVTINLGDLAAGTSAYVEFRVKVK